MCDMIAASQILNLLRTFDKTIYILLVKVSAAHLSEVTDIEPDGHG